jgi:hypothetical protein
VKEGVGLAKGLPEPKKLLFVDPERAPKKGEDDDELVFCGRIVAEDGAGLKGEEEEPSGVVRAAIVDGAEGSLVAEPNRPSLVDALFAEGDRSAIPVVNIPVESQRVYPYQGTHTWTRTGYRLWALLDGHRVLFYMRWPRWLG